METEEPLRNIIEIIREYKANRLTYADFVACLKGAYLSKSGYDKGSFLDVDRLKADLQEAGFRNLQSLWNEVID